MSTPIRGATTAYSTLCNKRPASDFARITRGTKKPRLVTTSARAVSRLAIDSGLDRSGIDKSSVSCGTQLREDTIGTPFTSLDGNASLTSPGTTLECWQVSSPLVT